MSEYTEQADNFLKSHNLEFRAVLVGDDCPRFCEDALKDKDMDKINEFPRKSHIHGKHYRCTISGAGRGHVSFDFWNSYADEEENAFAFGRVGNKEGNYWDKYRINGKYPNGPKLKKRHTPTPYDLLACLEKNEPGTFDNFCADYGYDTDSRRAEETYHAVVKEYSKIAKFFTAEELAELQEIN